MQACKPVKEICLINYENDAVVRILEEKYGCTVRKASRADDCGGDTVYVLSDFESEDFLKFRASRPNAAVVGPMVILGRNRRNMELPWPRPRRPIYNEHLKDVITAIGYGDEVERRRWTRLIRFMGGHVRKEIDATTTVLLTTQAKGRAYRQLVSLGQFVLLPQWIDECWTNRDNLEYNPFDSAVVEKHKLRVFENLTIYFFGFDDEETKDMTMNVIENGGSVVESPEGATHCVINSAADIPLGVRKLFSSAQRIVTNEWLWNSISIEYSANEEPYMIPDARTKLEVTSSPRAVTSFSITDTSRSDEGLSSEAATKKTKLQHLVDEMLFTDISYVNALKLLEEVKHDLEILADQPTELMDRQEIALIFGKVSPIVAVHEKIIKKIQECIAGGRHSDAVKSWIEAFDELNRVYSPFSNGFDVANETLTKADRSNPRLHAFFKVRECSAKFKRNTLKDLLIRPVQRLPTLMVLLREIQKVDKRSKTVEEAILLIDKVISRANSVRAENDIGIEQLSFFNDVEGVPPHLIGSRRKILRTTEGTLMCGTHLWQALTQRRIKVVLFNDLLLVCKVRTTSEGQNRISRLARQTSRSALGSEPKKPLKYVTHLLIPHIREINRVKLAEYDGVVIDRLEPQGVSPVFCWVTRDVATDTMFLMQSSNKQEALDFVDEVHKKLFMDFGRETSWNGIEIEDVPLSVGREMLLKHVKRMISHGSSMLVTNASLGRSSAFATFGRRSAKGLQRTVSQVTTRLAHPFSARNLRLMDLSVSTLQRPLIEEDDQMVKPPSISDLELESESESSVIEKVGSIQSLSLIEESETDVTSVHTAIPYYDDKENVI